MFSSPGSSSEHSDSLTEPTFDTLRRAVARVLPAADAERTELEALRLWAMVHGLVSLELSGLLPGTEQERQDRYRRVLHLHPLSEGTAAAGLALARPAETGRAAWRA